jgi:hypothetical protein
VSETQLHQDILVPMAGYLDVKYISFTLRFQYLSGVVAARYTDYELLMVQSLQQAV